MLVPEVSAASTSSTPSWRLVMVTVSELRTFGTFTSVSEASASAIATGPPPWAKLALKSAPLCRELSSASRSRTGGSLAMRARPSRASALVSRPTSAPSKNSVASAAAVPATSVVWVTSRMKTSWRVVAMPLSPTDASSATRLTRMLPDWRVVPPRTVVSSTSSRPPMAWSNPMSVPAIRVERVPLVVVSPTSSAV